jgi:hypothetical protein
VSFAALSARRRAQRRRTAAQQRLLVFAKRHRDSDALGNF